MVERKKGGNLKIGIFVVLGVLVAYFVVMAAVNARVNELQLQTKVLITEQEVLLAAIAETTARNGADAITESIIKDCTIQERNRFEELLVRLDGGLARSELIELERLFGRCGSFFAERKSVMVSRLAREIEVYQTFVSQLSNLSGQDEGVVYQVAEWQRLSELEQKQSKYFADLVQLQDEIITALLEGEQTDSERIQSILQSVNETRESLFVASKQAADVRAELISL